MGCTATENLCDKAFLSDAVDSEASGEAFSCCFLRRTPEMVTSDDIIASRHQMVTETGNYLKCPKAVRGVPLDFCLFVCLFVCCFLLVVGSGSAKILQ